MGGCFPIDNLMDFCIAVAAAASIKQVEKQFHARQTYKHESERKQRKIQIHSKIHKHKKKSSSNKSNARYCSDMSGDWQWRSERLIQQQQENGIRPRFLVCFCCLAVCTLVYMDNPFPVSCQKNCYISTLPASAKIYFLQAEGSPPLPLLALSLYAPTNTNCCCCLSPLRGEKVHETKNEDMLTEREGQKGGHRGGGEGMALCKCSSLIQMM